MPRVQDIVFSKKTVIPYYKVAPLIQGTPKKGTTIKRTDHVFPLHAFRSKSPQLSARSTFLGTRSRESIAVGTPEACRTGILGLLVSTLSR